MASFLVHPPSTFLLSRFPFHCVITRQTLVKEMLQGNHHTHCWLCMCCLYILFGHWWWFKMINIQAMLNLWIYIWFLFFIVFGWQNHQFRSLCSCCNNSNNFVIIIVQELLRNNATKEFLHNYGMIKNERRRISWIMLFWVVFCPAPLNELKRGGNEKWVGVVWTAGPSDPLSLLLNWF